MCLIHHMPGQTSLSAPLVYSEVRGRLRCRYTGWYLVCTIVVGVSGEAVVVFSRIMLDTAYPKLQRRRPQRTQFRQCRTIDYWGETGWRRRICWHRKWRMVENVVKTRLEAILWVSSKRALAGVAAAAAAARTGPLWALKTVASAAYTECTACSNKWWTDLTSGMSHALSALHLLRTLQEGRKCPTCPRSNWILMARAWPIWMPSWHTQYTRWQEKQRLMMIC